MAQEGQTIGIIAYISTPPADLQGFQFAVKSTAFSSDADRLSNKHADIDASSGKARDTFYGVAGSSYYISVRSYDFSKNFSEWKDYTSNPVELAGLTLDSLSEPISMAIYTGAFTATDADTVTWENSEKVKIKRTGGTTKEYTITGDASTRTTGNLTGTRYIVFNKATSTSILSVVTTPGDDDIVIAKVSPVTSGKANILRFVGNEEGEYSISRFSGGFNQLSAIVAEFGRILMVDGGYTKILIDSTQSPPVIRIAKDGYNATETDPNKLRWSSEFNNLKIVDQGIGSFTLPGYTVGAGSFNSNTVTIKSSVGIATARGVIGFSDIGGGYGTYRRLLPIISGYGNSESFNVSIAYSPSDDAIICTSEAWNWGAGTQTVNDLNFNLAWYLLGETLE